MSSSWSDLGSAHLHPILPSCLPYYRASHTPLHIPFPFHKEKPPPSLLPFHAWNTPFPFPLKSEPFLRSHQKCPCLREESLTSIHPQSYKILYCLSLHIFQFIYLDFAIPQSPMMPDRKQEGWWSRHQSRKMCEFHILWCKQHLASRIVIVMVQIAWLENLCTACQNSSTTVGSTHETVRRNTEATGSHPQVKEDDEIGGNLTVDPNNRFHLATQNFNKAG